MSNSNLQREEQLQRELELLTEIASLQKEIRALKDGNPILQANAGPEHQVPETQGEPPRKRLKLDNEPTNVMKEVPSIVTSKPTQGFQPQSSGSSSRVFTLRGVNFDVKPPGVKTVPPITKERQKLFESSPWAAFVNDGNYDAVHTDFRKFQAEASEVADEYIPNVKWRDAPPLGQRKCISELRRRYPVLAYQDPDWTITTVISRQLRSISKKRSASSQNMGQKPVNKLVTNVGSTAGPTTPTFAPDPLGNMTNAKELAKQKYDSMKMKIDDSLIDPALRGATLDAAIEPIYSMGGVTYDIDGRPDSGSIPTLEKEQSLYPPSPPWMGATNKAAGLVEYPSSKGHTSTDDHIVKVNQNRKEMPLRGTEDSSSEEEDMHVESPKARVVQPSPIRPTSQHSDLTNAPSTPPKAPKATPSTSGKGKGTARGANKGKIKENAGPGPTRTLRSASATAAKPTAKSGRKPSNKSAT